MTIITERERERERESERERERERDRERDRERERENRLACRAFSSLPTIREIMGLVMGIPVRV